MWGFGLFSFDVSSYDELRRLALFSIDSVRLGADWLSVVYWHASVSELPALPFWQS